MKTLLEWERAIIKTTEKINRDYPELTKYIKEKPANNSEDELANAKSLEEYHNSLQDILWDYAETQKNAETHDKEGYPLYPPSEDIYRQAKEETDLNPADPSKTKAPNEKRGAMNEKGFEDDMSGDDLDVPGSELDDQQESVGSEDEENNYYSLGGDNHNDLDEDRG